MDFTCSCTCTPRRQRLRRPPAADMARACKAAGYDLIAVTDHFFNANIGSDPELAVARAGGLPLSRLLCRQGGGRSHRVGGHPRLGDVHRRSRAAHLRAGRIVPARQSGHRPRALRRVHSPRDGRRRIDRARPSLSPRVVHSGLHARSGFRGGVRGLQPPEQVAGIQQARARGGAGARAADARRFRRPPRGGRRRRRDAL